jgi:alanine dehydrogenase
VNVPLSNGEFSQDCIHAELGEVIAGVKKGRESDKDITIFDSTGLAVQDLVTADMVYTKAVELGIGKKVKLF